MTRCHGDGDVTSCGFHGTRCIGFSVLFIAVARHFHVTQILTSSLFASFQDNEEDYEALGSLLSWDEAAEEDEKPQATSKPKETMAAMAEPPTDMVVFTTQDGVPQFNFFPHPEDNNPKAPAATAVADTSANQSNDAPSMSVPLPLPTPIAGMRTGNSTPVAQPVVSQPGPFVQQQTADLPGQQTQQQQQPPVAFPNANLFLRQLQFAQLQQQIQAAQMQQVQPTQPQQQNNQQAPQQQQNMQFPAQGFPNLMSFPVAPVQPPSVRQAVSNLAPAPKKQRTTPAPKTTRTRTTKKSVIGTVSASDTDGEAAAIASDLSAMEGMTPKEKAQANRDRNREHARNTRLRKKAYLEKLKTTVDELCRERDTLVSERAAAANLLLEVQTTRQEVILSFFALRTGNEKRRKLWASVLDESRCTCTLPVTPYRSFPASEVQLARCSRTIHGIDGVIADTASLHVLLDCMVDRASHPDGKISIRYTLVTEEAVIAQNQMMARFSMETTNAVAMGAKDEISKQGMLCCKFNSAHKITSLELTFDVMAFMLKLKKASGSNGFSVVPNTVQNCQQAFDDKPMVITMADPPYTIIQVNKRWEELTGYSAKEVVGLKSCQILQDAHRTQRDTVQSLQSDIRHRRSACVNLTNRHKDGTFFTHTLVLFPLSTESRIAYFAGFSLHVRND